MTKIHSTQDACEGIWVRQGKGLYSMLIFEYKQYLGNLKSLNNGMYLEE